MISLRDRDGGIWFPDDDGTIGRCVVIRRFVTNVDPIALVAAAEALSGHGVVVEHVADDPTGLRHIDVIEPEPAQKGHNP